jgi:glycosyltransferase involved in cell wall biosynthesis
VNHFVIRSRRSHGTGSPIKILALPREDNNPYQALLYGEMRRCGVQVSYVGSLTPSYTLNLLLMPLELVYRRMAGARLAHLHWTYNFRLYGSSRFPFLRRVAQAWFFVWLWTLQALGIRLVWTAHNVLPIHRGFADNLQVRRRIVAAADLVIAHSQPTLAQLAELGIVPRRSAIIPHGPYTPTLSADSLRTPGVGPGPRRVLFFGMVQPYKGIDNLLAAFAALPSDLDAQLVIVGECRDSSLKAALTELASRSPRDVRLHLKRVPDGEVSQWLESADVVVLPYRQTTTSGSAMLALSHGRPLVVPDLPGLTELPDDGVVRYDGTLSGLTNALVDLILADASVFARMSAAGYAYCSAISWSAIAKMTLDEMSGIFSGA